MEYPIFQVDAFSSERFKGNPAAVVIMSQWLPDEKLQAIAAENNLSETAFVMPGQDAFDLRWFSPTIEVDLCGHATLAAGFALLSNGYAPGPKVTFHTASGDLTVERDGELLAMDFPSLPAKPVSVEADLVSALGRKPVEAHRARDLLAIFETESEIATLRPDFSALEAIDVFGVIVSAPGQECDFVSRFFAPGAGVPEDPVTGSTHCTLTPYWSKRLGKTELRARQLSERGGEVFCRDLESRVRIAGHAVQYLKGHINV